MQRQTFLKKNIPAAGLCLCLLIPAISFGQEIRNTLNAGGNLPQNGENSPQFIEDFYHNPQPLPTPVPQSAKILSRGIMRPVTASLTYADQRNTGEVLSGDSDAENIGGMDYPAGELGAEDNAIYQELFLANESSTETFDPSQMTDSIPVYLVSPWSGTFHMPVAGNRINSDYGWRHGRFHTGMDLHLDLGDTVMAAFNGIVEKAEYYGGYGNLVVMKNFNGLQTYYAHLSKIKVNVGDTLVAGQLLGLGGSTGHSTGPHLHFEVRYRGVPMDPKNIIDFNKSDLISPTCTLTKSSFDRYGSGGSSAASAGSKYYIIRKGDTLSRIAVRNGTTVSRLCKLNGISSRKILKPGMRLRIH